MASAIEIGRQRVSEYERTVSVLVRPPLMNFDRDRVGADIDRGVFGREHESRIGGNSGISCREKVRLGDVSQIIDVAVFDSRSEEGVELTSNLAVDALHTYVTAMAEGDVDKLLAFLPQK